MDSILITLFVLLGIAAIVLVYCFAKLIVKFAKWCWHTCGRVIFCGMCIWCCVPCHKCWRACCQESTDSCARCGQCCDEHYHPWKKMEIHDSAAAAYRV